MSIQNSLYSAWAGPGQTFFKNALGTSVTLGVTYFAKKLINDAMLEYEKNLKAHVSDRENQCYEQSDQELRQKIQSDPKLFSTYESKLTSLYYEKENNIAILNELITDSFWVTNTFLNMGVDKIVGAFTEKILRPKVGVSTISMSLGKSLSGIFVKSKAVYTEIIVAGIFSVLEPIKSVFGHQCNLSSYYQRILSVSNRTLYIYKQFLPSSMEVFQWCRHRWDSQSSSQPISLNYSSLLSTLYSGALNFYFDE